MVDQMSALHYVNNPLISRLRCLHSNIKAAYEVRRQVKSLQISPASLWLYPRRYLILDYPRHWLIGHGLDGSTHTIKSLKKRPTSGFIASKRLMQRLKGRSIFATFVSTYLWIIACVNILIFYQRELQHLQTFGKTKVIIFELLAMMHIWSYPFHLF